MSENRRVALIGLGVMGRSLALNMRDHGINVSAFSISAEERTASAAEVPVNDSLPELVAGLAAPRVVFLMVTAGQAVDELVQQLLALLSPDDIIIDGGNSHYLDTERRAKLCSGAGVRFLGVGISGGEEGARHGASVMVGGDEASFAATESLFAAIATQVQGDPCYGWLGHGGAGHFVKTVHNGIEYGVMQLIAESYDFLLRVLGLPMSDVQAWFTALRGGELDSYLIDITSSILAKAEGESLLIEKVKDVAEQKGTGRWCVDAALTLGVPVPTISAAVTERQISGSASSRAQFAARAVAPEAPRIEAIESLSQDVAHALHVGILATFAQGLELIHTASAESGWRTELTRAIKLWRGGCIIRAAMLDDFLLASETLSRGENLLLDERIYRRLQAGLPGMRRVVAAALTTGVPLPGMSSALNYIDSLSTTRLPTHLIQAQRDCFGAHQFERTDKSGRFHADWLAS